ncbi:unnamed protein product, partial [marine sediment metagenome]
SIVVYGPGLFVPAILLLAPGRRIGYKFDHDVLLKIEYSNGEQKLIEFYPIPDYIGRNNWNGTNEQKNMIVSYIPPKISL